MSDEAKNDSASRGCKSITDADAYDVEIIAIGDDSSTVEHRVFVTYGLSDLTEMLGIVTTYYKGMGYMVCGIREMPLAYIIER